MNNLSHFQSKAVKLFTTVGLLLLVSACTTINVDQVRLKDTVEWEKGDAMVVLGRHQTPEIQTEASKLRKVLNEPLVADKLNAMRIKYFVWVEGSTERTGAAGSLTCSIGPGGGGCFGFGTWEDTSDYETTIWDVATLEEVGRVSTEAVGTSYMPAFVVPIPLLAQVEGDACNGMGRQLVRFFDKSDASELKTLK